MGLDINTPKGRKTVRDEQDAARLLEWARRVEYVPTDNRTSDVCYDAIILKDGVLAAFAETKCRYDLTLNKLRQQFDNEWLITYQKITDLQVIGALSRKPSVGILYLVDDPRPCVLVVPLTGPDGKIVCKYRVEDTRTQRTVNGGSIVRTNAFVDVSKARVIRYDEAECCGRIY